MTTGTGRLADVVTARHLRAVAVAAAITIAISAVAWGVKPITADGVSAAEFCDVVPDPASGRDLIANTGIRRAREPLVQCGRYENPKAPSR